MYNTRNSYFFIFLPVCRIHKHVNTCMYTCTSHSQSLPLFATLFLLHVNSHLILFAIIAFPPYPSLYKYIHVHVPWCYIVHEFLHLFTLPNSFLFLFTECPRFILSECINWTAPVD